ncbi:hypothetical protein [Alteromonas sp. a30]|uniref:hypothetical protein n=1 Tax=Alteromonas sp. a30 TaxID=2730917 RepID=UPI00227F9588|nr:hypothetical protein [Alteromonas sp. a30]MCY7294788.1 glycine zipper family protein [Alteromonas sp. a30]
MSKPRLFPPLKASVLGSILLLSACANTGVNYRPVVDGSELAHYETDLANCQKLAVIEEKARNESESDALFGAMIGALAGITEGAEETIAGAAIGALIGEGVGQNADNQVSRQTVINCMRGKGYNVVESDN